MHRTSRRIRFHALLLAALAVGACGTGASPGQEAGGADSVVVGAGSGVEVVGARSDVDVVDPSAGSSTWTVTVCPPSSVTVMVRSSADAGKTAALKPAVNAPADMSPISSLRRLIR